MKAKYISPKMVVVRIRHKNNLLTTSYVNVGTKEYDEEEVVF